MNTLEGRGDDLVSREPRQRPEGLFDNHPHKVRAGAESESPSRQPGSRSKRLEGLFDDHLPLVPRVLLFGKRRVLMLLINPV